MGYNDESIANTWIVRKYSPYKQITVMNRLEAYYRQNRINFVFLILVSISCYGLNWILDWNANRISASIIALPKENVSEIKIFDSKASQNPLLVTLTNPKDNEPIFEFIQAINKAIRFDPPYRELILSHGLYVVISLTDSDKPIELLFHLRDDCRNTIYIDIVKKPGGVESYSTSYIGGIKSEIFLYDWLRNLNLLGYLGCD